MIARLFWFFAGSILYTYLGYPAILALLARFRPKPKTHAQVYPSVTLLIAAYNEEAVIANKIENTLQLDYPRKLLQILIVTDGSDDETPNIVRRYAEQDVELLHTPERRGKMAAINRAMPCVRGRIVVFSDANNMYSPETLRELMAPFADPHVGATSGAKVIARGDGALGESEDLYWKYESFIKQQESRLGSCTGVAGEIFAVRRALYIPPPDQIINDDFYLAMQILRQRKRVVYVPKARSVERVSALAQGEITRRARIVAGRYQAMAMSPQYLSFRQPLIAWQVISHKFLRPLVPFAMLGTLVTNLIAVLRPQPARKNRLARLASPFNYLLLAAQGIFYALSWLGNQVESEGRTGKLLYLPAFLVNSNYAAAIGLVRFMRGQQSTQWRRVQRRGDTQDL